MSRRATRLYRKPTGVYWLRIVLPPGVIPLRVANAKPSQSPHAEDLLPPCGQSSPPGKTAAATNLTAKKHPQSRHELRRSLTTTCSKKATTLVSIINAVLSVTPSSRWEQTMSGLLRDFGSSWTLPGGLSVSDDDDQRRLQIFFKENPAFRDAALQAVQQAATAAPLLGSPPQAPHPALAAGTVGATAHIPAAFASAPHTPHLGAAASGTTFLPKNPMRFNDAKAWFKQRRVSQRSRKKGSSRTIEDQDGELTTLGEHLETSLGANPWVHDIQTHHLAAYLDMLSKRPGRHKDENGQAKPLSGLTLEKRSSTLAMFFQLMFEVGNIHIHNPATGLGLLRKEYVAQGKDEMQPYAPYHDAHIKLIFSPLDYLLANRTPDKFWMGLIAAHMGLRLSEILTRTVNDVRVDDDGIWFLAVPFGKTKNSVRIIPIPVPLIELGFIEYVEHVRALPATQLFPQLNLKSESAQRKPGNKQTEAYGMYLDTRGLTDPRLTFHSFRHTVVNALLDNNTPVHLSMQICGHDAQEEAVRRKLLTEKAAASVHLTTYAQADLPSLGRVNALVPMKKALESSVKLPLCYPALKIAAGIVQERVRKVGDKCVAGWPGQSKKDAEQMEKRFRALCLARGLSEEDIHIPIDAGG